VFQETLWRPLLANYNSIGTVMKYPNIIKLYKVQKLTTFSRSTIYRLIAEGKFPKQIKLAERSSGWVEQEVIDYLENCIEDRNVDNTNEGNK